MMTHEEALDIIRNAEGRPTVTPMTRQDGVPGYSIQRQGSLWGLFVPADQIGITGEQFERWAQKQNAAPDGTAPE